MTAIHPTVPTFLIAIDISKFRRNVLIDVSGKKRRYMLKITNTSEDFERLSMNLDRCDQPVRIEFKATTNYQHTLAHHLCEADFESEARFLGEFGAYAENSTQQL